MTYEGLLSLHSYGEADDILFLSSLQDPIAEVLQERIADKRVTVRYWTADRQATREEIQEASVRTMLGDASCEFGARYSEITGYLWTDEECRIGGHDLLEELRSHVGKWVVLEIDIHEGGPNP